MVLTPAIYTRIGLLYVVVADDCELVEGGNLPEARMHPWQIVVRNMRERMVCKVVTIVVRIKQHRHETKIGSFPGVSKDPTGLRSVVIIHFTECCDGVKYGRLCDDPYRKKEKIKIPAVDEAKN